MGPSYRILVELNWFLILRFFFFLYLLNTTILLTLHLWVIFWQRNEYLFLISFNFVSFFLCVCVFWKKSFYLTLAESSLSSIFHIWFFVFFTLGLTLVYLILLGIIIQLSYLFFFLSFIFGYDLNRNQFIDRKDWLIRRFEFKSLIVVQIDYDQFALDISWWGKREREREREGEWRFWIQTKNTRLNQKDLATNKTRAKGRGE